MTSRTPPDAATAPAPERIRYLFRDGVQWRVYERPSPVYDRRSTSDLFFESESAVRRVRQFPPDWHTLSDDELYALSHRR